MNFFKPRFWDKDKISLKIENYGQNILDNTIKELKKYI